MENDELPNLIVEPNRRQDWIVGILSVILVYGAICVRSGFGNLGGSLIVTVLHLPGLAILFCISYFLTRNTGRWHLPYILLTLCLVGAIGARWII